MNRGLEQLKRNMMITRDWVEETDKQRWRRNAQFSIFNIQYYQSMQPRTFSSSSLPSSFPLLLILFLFHFLLCFALFFPFSSFGFLLLYPHFLFFVVSFLAVSLLAFNFSFLSLSSLSSLLSSFLFPLWVTKREREETTWRRERGRASQRERWTRNRIEWKGEKKMKMRRRSRDEKNIRVKREIRGGKRQGTS